MNDWGTVGSPIERHCTNVMRPGRRILLPQTAHCESHARKTSKLAFPGQTVRPHQQFQIGAHDQNDLASFLSRCAIVLGSVQNTANLAALKLKGWTDAETTAFQTPRNAFGPAEQCRVQQISGAKSTTTQKNTHADTLYENVLTTQHAADLQFPEGNPANAGVRGQFLLGIFPPDHGGTPRRRLRNRKLERKENDEFLEKSVWR
jgi:hypothetical protein